ncbi:MAG TPA: hypothetical protein VFV73_09555 [Streptosporangiaceae bacterium]|nr:hypothetical protein [Streptosporangiaceae bacterium]
MQVSTQFGILTLSPGHVNTFQHSGARDEVGVKATMNIGSSLIDRERFAIWLWLNMLDGRKRIKDAGRNVSYSA